MNLYRYLLILLVFTINVVNAQHDAGRNAVKFLAKGDFDKTLEALEKEAKTSNSPLNVSEKWFITAMVHSQKNEVDKAYHAAMKALDTGIRPERFFMSHGGVFTNLYKYKKFRKWMKANESALIHGPLLGSVTATSANFWVRTSKESKVTVELIEETTNKRIVSNVFKTKRDTDYTTIVEVSGLNSNAAYRYDVLVNGKKLSKNFQFKTFPSQLKPAVFELAYGGGSGYTEKNEYMWNTMNSFNPLATLLLGDNVYIDDPEHSLTDYYCYYRRQSRPEFREYVGSNSIYSIYDDHDFGDNDIIPGPEIETPMWKREVWNIFKQNWNNPGYGGGEKQPGCWYDYYIGDVHFIMLDTRYYRDLDNGNMLGNVQKEWLFKTLKSSKGKFKILASSVPWSPGVKPKSKDTWDGYSDQREEIFSFIGDNTIEGIVLLAADRHRSDFRKIERPNGYQLYEAMSSRLTNVHVHSLMEKAKGSEFLMGYNEDCSFGYLKFNTEKSDPEIIYQIINIDGEMVDERRIRLSQLTFKE